MIKVTEAAMKQITHEVQDIISEGKKPLVRLDMGIGWGGPQLRLSLEEAALENDTIIEENGIIFLINDTKKSYFEHAKIDYTKTVFGEGKFVILTI